MSGHVKSVPMAYNACFAWLEKGCEPVSVTCLYYKPAWLRLLRLSVNGLIFFLIFGWIDSIVFQTYGVLLVASCPQVKTLISLWCKR